MARSWEPRRDLDASAWTPLCMQEPRRDLGASEWTPLCEHAKQGGEGNLELAACVATWLPHVTIGTNA